MNNSIGFPTKVPGYPGYVIVDCDEDTAIMRVGRESATEIARVPCDWAMEEGMPRIVAEIQRWEREHSMVFQEDDGEPEPYFLS